MENLPLQDLGLILLYAVIALLTGPIFAWLRQKANTQKLLAQSEIDDHVLGALEIAVNNIARDQRRKIEDQHPLTEQDKLYLEGLAKTTAAGILQAKGIALGKVTTDAAVSAIIRYLVDKSKA